MGHPASPAGMVDSNPLFTTEPGSHMLVEMAMSRGLALLRAEQWHEAAGAFAEAARLSDDDALGQASRADAHRQVAIAQLRRGAWDEAEAALSRSYGLATGLEDPGRMALARNAAAAVAFERGDWSRSSDLYEEARRHARAAVNHRLLAQIDNNEGALWSALGDPKRAEACFRRALEHFDTLENHPCASRALNNLGIALVAQHRLWEADTVYERAMQLCKHHGDGTLIAQILVNRADLSLLRGNEHQSQSLATRAVAFADRTGNVSVGVCARRVLSAVARGIDEISTAKHHIKDALDLCLEAEVPLAEAEAWVELGHVYHAEHRPDKAIEAWQRAHQGFETLGNAEATHRVNELLHNLNETQEAA